MIERAKNIVCTDSGESSQNSVPSTSKFVRENKTTTLSVKYADSQVTLDTNSIPGPSRLTPEEECFHDFSDNGSSDDYIPSCSDTESSCDSESDDKFIKRKITNTTENPVRNEEMPEDSETMEISQNMLRYEDIVDIGKDKNHKFPVVGHSYLDSDRDFGRIEKVLRKHSTIYTPGEYRTIIKSASVKHSVVFNMENHFKNIEEIEEKMHLYNRKKNVLNDPVCFRDGVKWIRVEEYGSYLYKHTLDECTPFLKVDIMRSKCKEIERKDFTLRSVTLKQNKISEEKISNLQEQLVMGQTWTIVYFLMENSVEAVPTIWIVGNMCYWPSFTADKVNKAIRNYEHPDTCCESFEIRSFRNATYNTYKEASHKSGVAINNSDINEEEEESRETRKSRSEKRI
ncbi:unnamed protein product [Phaedon cochleariae]|uniref:Uncharacterized protein n=1 Tax=Phaedon cochleariae TaxID=80249 RepID=A0A9N9SHD2_PHACE|nr:unnamed protein product [Phaedon cochleariae]